MNSPAIIKHRRDTAANWAAVTAQPLYDGQLGLEIVKNAQNKLTNVKVKVGDGISNWAELPYLAGNSLSDSTTSTQSGYFGDIYLWDNISAGTNRYLTISSYSDPVLAGNRNLEINVGNANRKLNLLGELTVVGKTDISGTNSGDQTITLTGPVTGSGTGSFVTNITDGAVGYAKIQNVTTSRLLGRATAGSGVVEEISLTSPLIFSSGALAFKISSANNRVLFNNSNSDLSTSANFTFNSTTNKLSVSGGLVSDLIETTGLFYLNSTAANGTGLFAVFSNAPSNGIAAVSIGNTLHNNGTLVVYGTSTVTGAIKIGSSGSGNIQDNNGNNKISFTSTDVTMAGNLTVTGTNTNVTATNFLGNATTATTLANGRTIGMTGDVSWTSASFNGGGNVTGTSTINSGVVTYAKMQNVSNSSRLLGRATAGAGVVEEITIGSGLTLTGTTLSSSGGSTPNNGILTLNVSGTGLSGSQTFTANQSTDAIFTVTSNATSANSNGAIVARDGSGDFSAGVITANGYRVTSSVFNSQTGAYTLAATDNGKIVTINSSTDVNVTVGTAAGTQGFTCTIIALGTGKVTLIQSSTTLNWYGGTGNVAIAGRYGSAALVAYAANTFSVSGTLQ